LARTAYSPRGRVRYCQLPEKERSPGSSQEQIAQLQNELDAITSKVDAYDEALLQSHLTNEVIEEQELSILYKAQKAQLEKALAAVKNKHSYHVLNTYNDPSTFVNELRAYYQDRMQKLRRRTRVQLQNIPSVVLDWVTQYPLKQL
jgi:uncharacterized protein involved in tolerance to divalent cations